jgi:hypothetical protein
VQASIAVLCSGHGFVSLISIAARSRRKIELGGNAKSEKWQCNLVILTDWVRVFESYLISLVSSRQTLDEVHARNRHIKPSGHTGVPRFLFRFFFLVALQLRKSTVSLVMSVCPLARNIANQTKWISNFKIKPNGYQILKLKLFTKIFSTKNEI